MSNFDRVHYRHAREQHKNHWLSVRDKATKGGFPQDDEFSMMQGCPGDSCNLDFWYDSQYVQCETTNHCKGTIRSTYLLEHTPVLPGTMTFTVYMGCTQEKAQHAIQNGYVKSSGEFHFDKRGNPEVFAVAGSLNHVTGEVTIRFNKEPGDNFIVANYEYNMECQPNDQ